jgi:hypothetical protein
MYERRFPSRVFAAAVLQRRTGEPGCARFLPDYPMPGDLAAVAASSATSHASGGHKTGKPDSGSLDGMKCAVKGADGPTEPAGSIPLRADHFL